MKTNQLFHRSLLGLFIFLLSTLPVIADTYYEYSGKKTISMKVGEKVTLNPTSEDNYSYYSTQAYNGYFSSIPEGLELINESTITVSANWQNQTVTFPAKCEIRALKSGTYTITHYMYADSKNRVYFTGQGRDRPEGQYWVKFTYTIKVSSVEPTSVSFKPSSQEIAINESIDLLPTVSLSPQYAETTYSWRSGNTGIATVRSGVVTGIKEGTTTIWVNTSNGLSASCSVTVKPKPIQIELSPSVKVVAGQSITLTPTITPFNAKYTLTWSSKNNNIARVSSSGVVRGIGAGTTFIIVETNNGLKDSCEVTVIWPDPTGVALPSMLSVEMGETVILKPTLTPSNAATTFTWSSEDSNIATVSVSGEVKGIESGTTTIRVETSNGLSAIIQVKVISRFDPQQYDSSEMIVFEDDLVKNLCVNNWDTNGDGSISFGEAAAVTDLGTVFKKNQQIKSFNELRYFIGLTTIGESAFYDCGRLSSVMIPNSVTIIGKDAFKECI